MSTVRREKEEKRAKEYYIYFSHCLWIYFFFFSHLFSRLILFSSSSSTANFHHLQRTKLSLHPPPHHQYRGRKKEMKHHQILRPDLLSSWISVQRRRSHFHPHFYFHSLPFFGTLTTHFTYFPWSDLRRRRRRRRSQEKCSLLHPFLRFHIFNSFFILLSLSSFISPFSEWNFSSFERLYLTSSSSQW